MSLLIERLKTLRETKLLQNQVNLNPQSNNDVHHERKATTSQKHHDPHLVESFRNQFLNKTASSEEVTSYFGTEHAQNNILLEDPQIQGIYNRAQEINSKLVNFHQPVKQFYARVPVNIKDKPFHSSHSSPLLQSNHNALYKFQATADNVKEVMIDSNPYGDVPYQTQVVGNKIGADLDFVRNNMHVQLRHRKISQPSVADKCVSRVEEEIVETNPVPVVEKADKSTQTTQNTGNLHFEITDNDMKNLSSEKKNLLLKFMDAFNIHDSRNVGSIQERLKHRLSNKELKRRWDQPPKEKSSSNSHSASDHIFGPHI